MSIYFTADTHFCHKSIIQYCNRPFSSIEEHDKALMKNWNSVVRKKDIVYHLGDFCISTAEKHLEILNQLNGQIFLIRGNHDRISAKVKKKFAFVKDLYKLFAEFKGENYTIVLCHYPMARWDKSHHGSWHLHGHCHGTFSSIGKSMDVGVDVNNYFPVSLETVIQKLKNIPYAYED